MQKLLKGENMLDNIKYNKIQNNKYINTPSIEITHFNESDKESKKETFPLSRFLDQECHNLKFNDYLN